MSAIDDACEAYERQLRQPWRTNVSGAEKVWMLVYRPDSDRRLRHRLPMFETTTLAAGKKWQLLDIGDAFETWLSEDEYRDSYFKDPKLLEQGAFDDFAEWLGAVVDGQFQVADENTVVALLGAAGIFGIMRLSILIQQISPRIPGRLLVFFPGTRDDNNYRLLDGYDGWNYLAVAIN